MKENIREKLQKTMMEEKPTAHSLFGPIAHGAKKLRVEDFELSYEFGYGSTNEEPMEEVNEDEVDEALPFFGRCCPCFRKTDDTNNAIADENMIHLAPTEDFYKEDASTADERASRTVITPATSKCSQESIPRDKEDEDHLPSIIEKERQFTVKNQIFFSEKLEVCSVFWIEGDDEVMKKFKANLPPGFDARPLLPINLKANTQQNVYMRFCKRTKESVYHIDNGKILDFLAGDVKTGEPRAFDFRVEPVPELIPDVYIDIDYFVRINGNTEERVRPRFQHPLKAIKEPKTISVTANIVATDGGTVNDYSQNAAKMLTVDQ